LAGYSRTSPQEKSVYEIKQLLLSRDSLVGGRVLMSHTNEAPARQTFPEIPLVDAN
jgi:hypothetical protein